MSYNWRAETLTPSSIKQADQYRHMRHAQSPDGRFTLRHLRGSSSLFGESSVSYDTKEAAKGLWWITTVIGAGLLLGWM